MAKKTFSRNELASYSVGFFKEPGVPIIPLSPMYPTFTIRNPVGDIVHSGVAAAYSTPGNYRVQWTIPTEAALSTDENGWYIEFVMVSNDNRQLKYKENFLVIDNRTETPIDTSIIQVVQDIKTFRVANYFESDPVEVQLDIYEATNTATPILTYNLTSATPLVGPIDVDGHIGYYIDVAGGLTQQDYLIIWTYRNSLLAEESREFKTLRSVRTAVLRYVDQLRILIDRFNKRQSSPNAYSDSDMIEFLSKGLNLVNAWYPINIAKVSWDTVDTSGLGIFVISAAAKYALQSQYLLEADLAFQFSGQTVTLDYDRTSAIDAAISKLDEFLTNNLSKAKVALGRSAAIGSIGVRPYSLFNNARARVIQYEGNVAGVGGGITDLIVMLGL